MSSVVAEVYRRAGVQRRDCECHTFIVGHMSPHRHYLVQQRHAEAKRRGGRTGALQHHLEALQVSSPVPFEVTPRSNPVIPEAQRPDQSPVPPRIAFRPVHPLQRHAQESPVAALGRRANELLCHRTRAEAIVRQRLVAVLREQASRPDPCGDRDLPSTDSTRRHTARGERSSLHRADRRPRTAACRWHTPGRWRRRRARAASRAISCLPGLDAFIQRHPPGEFDLVDAIDARARVRIEAEIEQQLERFRPIASTASRSSQPRSS